MAEQLTGIQLARYRYITPARLYISSLKNSETFYKMDDTFDQTLKKLGEKVSQITDTNTMSYSSSIKGIRSKINIKIVLVYGVPFILTGVALFFLKPRFVAQDNDEDSEMKLSFRKMLISILIIGGVISILIFLYLRKKEIRL